MRIIYFKFLLNKMRELLLNKDIGIRAINSTNKVNEVSEEQDFLFV